MAFSLSLKGEYMNLKIIQQSLKLDEFKSHLELTQKYEYIDSIEILCYSSGTHLIRITIIEDNKSITKEINLDNSLSYPIIRISNPKGEPK